MALTKSFVQNAATTPVDGRFMLAGMLQKKADNTVRVGQLWGGSADVTSTTASAPMTVQIAAGSSWALSRGYSDGAVIVANNGAATVNIADAPNANSRYDLVWMRHNDSTVGDADSNPVFGVTTGTAAASPTVPTAPSGALALATVLVPAGVTTTSASGVTITNVYPFAAVSGSPIRYRSVSDLRADAANVIDGALGYVKGAGLYWMRGSWQRADVAPFVVIQQQAGSTYSAASGTTLGTLGGNNPSYQSTDTTVFPIRSDGVVGPLLVSGWYDVSGGVTWSTNSTGERYIEITVDDTGVTPGIADRRAASGNSPASVSGLVQANAGQYIKLKGWQSSGSSLFYLSRLVVRLVQAN